MHYENLFELIIAVVFAISTQIGGLGTKAKDFVIPFHLSEEETLSYFHLRTLAIRSELVLMRDKIGQINNLTVKYIMELSKLKHIQRYMNSFEIEFRRFGRQPQSDQLSIIFTPKVEEIFETLETADIDMYPSHSMIEPIVKNNFENTFQHQNGPNRRQHTHKNTSHQ